jgi:hypothetical protein
MSRLFLSFEVYLYHKQHCDKKEKSNENLITSFVEFLVRHHIFAVRENHDDDKSDEK